LATVGIIVMGRSAATSLGSFPRLGRRTVTPRSHVRGIAPPTRHALHSATSARASGPAGLRTAPAYATNGTPSWPGPPLLGTSSVGPNHHTRMSKRKGQGNRSMARIRVSIALRANFHTDIFPPMALSVSFKHNGQQVLPLFAPVTVFGANSPYQPRDARFPAPRCARQCNSQAAGARYPHRRAACHVTRYPPQRGAAARTHALAMSDRNVIHTARFMAGIWTQHLDPVRIPRSATPQATGLPYYFNMRLNRS
jgi:hypothetical protein